METQLEPQVEKDMENSMESGVIDWLKDERPGTESQSCFKAKIKRGDEDVSDNDSIGQALHPHNPYTLTH